MYAESIVFCFPPFPEVMFTCQYENESDGLKWTAKNSNTCFHLKYIQGKNSLTPYSQNKNKFLFLSCRKTQMVVILPPLVVQRSHRFSAVNVSSQDYIKVSSIFFNRMVLQQGCITLGCKFFSPPFSMNVQNYWMYFW